jgi:DNA-binding transcriptional LysR family regulator
MRRVRLAAFTSALSSFVPAAVRDLRRAYADLVVQVLQLETQEAIERIRGGGADLAVVHHMPGVAVPETAGLRRRRLLVDHLHIVVPEGHRLARREEVSVADLEEEPLILPRRDTPAGRFRSVFEQLCAQAGFEPRVVYEIDDLPAAQAFVAAGIAVVPMHGLILATIPSGTIALRLAERPAGSRTVEALASAAAQTPVVDDFLELLAESALARRL